MKIFFVRHSLLNRGGDKMILEYASYLAEMGNEVSIKTNLKNTVFYAHPKIRFIPILPKGKFGTIISIFKEKLDADILVADIIPMAIFLSIRNRRKVVYFAQDYNENSYPNIVQKYFIRFLYHLGLSILNIPIIAVSEELAEIFLNRFRSSSFLIRNGVKNLVFYPGDEKELKASKKGRKAILFFARNDYRKGFDLALDIIKRVVSLSPSTVEIWAVGEQVVLGEDVPLRNFGYVVEDELRKIFSSADVFLYPSRSEGFPLMVMEAFACKCPVVTTEAVSYAEHGKNALVGKIGDIEKMTTYVLALLSDGTLVEKITSGGLSFAEEHSLERSCALFEKALRNVYRQL